MRRLLAALLGLLILLVLADRFVQERQEARLRRDSALRSLVQVEKGEVREVRVVPAGAGRAWTYVWQDESWRYPDYFDSYVLPDRMERLLASLLESLGTVVGVGEGEFARFDVDTGRAVEIDLHDGSGALLLDALIGRGAPGAGAGETYVRRARDDTVFHLHANPLTALGRSRPPMLDPQVLPRALPRSSIARVTFERPSHPERGLRRVRLAMAGPFAPGGMPQGPTYAWLVGAPGREDTCLSASAFAYVGFLSRLRFEALQDPAGEGYGFEREARLSLVDDDGVVDVLQIGATGPDGNVYLRNRTTRQVCTITPQKAELLFPSRAALLDTLPRPSPYQQAEPFGPGPP